VGGRLLQWEHAAVTSAIDQKIENATDLTVGTDVWTDNAGHAVAGTTAIFIDRSVEMLSTDDISLDSHTGEFIAGTYPHHRHLQEGFITGQ
jgi:hypothetical protein